MIIIPQTNYQLLRAILDHEHPERIPSFHLGYASRVLEQAIAEFKPLEDEDVCLYFDEGPEPKQGMVDLTLDHLLGYTGHYSGSGPVHLKTVGNSYIANREDIPFEKRFLKPNDFKASRPDLKNANLWHVGFFGECSATRVNAGADDEGFTTYYADGLMSPDTIDFMLAENEYTPQSPKYYSFLGQMTKDLKNKPDWSFPVIGNGGITDSTMMCLKGNYGSFARYARTNPKFLDRLIKAMFETIRDCVYLPLLEAGVPLIYWGEDLGQKERLLISPPNYQRFFSKYLKELTKLVHSYNARLVMHSDGNVSEIVPTLIECGIDGLQALEPASGMKLGEMVQKYGSKLAYLGALDQRVLCWGIKVETIQMTKKAIRDAAEANGYFALGPSHQPIGAKVENLFAMMETIKKYGIYPIDFSKLK